ncbi:MAG: transposase [Ruminococcus sp.]|nr:transposase [Ruminococcus sp.]
MGTGRQYDEKFKVEAVKLARETGTKRAAEELGILEGTLGGWVRKAGDGEIDTGSGSRSPGEALNLAQQLQEKRKKNKALEKRIKELEELMQGIRGIKTGIL